MKTLNIAIDKETVRVDDDGAVVHHFSEFYLEKLAETGGLSMEEQTRLGWNIYENIFATAKRKERFENILNDLAAGDELVLNIRSQEEDIHNIPFELINPEGNPTGFLLKKGNISVIRTIPALDKTIETRGKPVRILILLSLPLATYRRSPFNVLKELKTISGPLYPYIQAGLVEVDIEEKVNIPRIRERVLKKKYDIVHFSGHGARGGHLVIEDEEYWEWEKLIDGKQVKDIFQNSGITLFYFDACETAQAGELQPSLAYRIYENIPTAAVIANLAVVEDRNATEATKYIYETLFEGRNFGSVLNGVRLKLHTDWWKPVAFGDPEQQMFHIDKTAKKKAKKKGKRIVLRSAEPSVHYVYRYGIVRRASALVEEKNYLVLHGIGGAGKSTFANYLSEFYDSRFKHILFFDLKALDMDKPAKLLDRMLEELEIKKLITNEEAKRFYSSKRPGRVLDRQKADFIEEKLHDPYMQTLLILDNLEETIQDEGGVIKKEWYDLVNFFLNSRTFFTIFTSRLRPYLTGRQPLDNLLEIGEYEEGEFAFLYNDLGEKEKGYLDRKGADLLSRCGYHPLSISKALEKKFDDLTKLVSLREFKDIFEFYRPYFDGFKEETEILFYLGWPFSDVFIENLFPSDFVDLLKNKLLILKNYGPYYQPYSIMKFYFKKDFEIDESNFLKLAKKLLDLFKMSAIEKSSDFDIFNIFFIIVEYYEKSRDEACEACLIEIYNAIDFEIHPQLLKLIHEKFVPIIDSFSIDEDERGDLYNAVGKVYGDYGEYNEAVEFFEKALEIKKRRDGEEHPGTAAIYSSIGILYHSRGLYQEAMSYQQKALRIIKSPSAEDSKYKAFVYSNIAALYREQGEYNEALEYFIEALKIYESKFGKDHKYTASAYNDIAWIYTNIGKYREARDCFGKASEINKATLGENHPSIALIENNIGDVYRKQGEYKKAMGYYKKALEATEWMYGKHHIYTAVIIDNIAAVYLKEQKLQEAEAYYKMAMEITEAKLGTNHPYTATVYNDITALYKIQGRYQDALEYLNKALKIYNLRWGEAHPSVATVYGNIGLIYIGLGRHREALTYFEKARKIYEKNPGGDPTDISTIYNNIAETYLHESDYGEALKYYEKALKIAEPILGSNHPNIASIQVKIAQVYYEQGQYEEASRYFQKALDIFNDRKEYENVFMMYPVLIPSLIQSGGDYTRIANAFCHFFDLFDIYKENDNQQANDILSIYLKKHMMNDITVEKINEKIGPEICKNKFDHFVKWLNALSWASPVPGKTAEEDKAV